LSQELRPAAWIYAAIILGVSVCGLGCGDDTAPASSAGPTEPPESFGPPGTGFVSAGVVATNGKFKLVYTVGQSTQNQETMTSPGLRLQGGVIGANEGLP
jgi:hypothetical protein